MKNITVKAEYGNKLVDNKWDTLDEWQKKAHPYTVTVKYDKKQMTVPFFMGPALTHEPTKEDVMPCLAHDYVIYQNYDFEGFCEEFGYDKDNKAHETWKACQKNGKNVERVFGFDADKIAGSFM